MLAERVDVWIQRGVQQGIQQGIQQGVQQGLSLGHLQGECAIVKRQLEKKFGPLTPQQRAYVENLNESGLLELSDKLLDAQALEDIFP